MARRRLFEDFIDNYGEDTLVDDIIMQEEDVRSPFCLYITIHLNQKAKESEKALESAILLFQKKIRNLASKFVSIKSINKFLYKTERDLYRPAEQKIGNVTICTEENSSLDYRNISELECYIYFTPVDDFSWKDTWNLYKFFNYVYSIRGSINQIGRDIAVMKIVDGLPKDDQDWDSWGSDLELSKQTFDSNAVELCELGHFIFPKLDYDGFLKAFNTNGFEFMLRNYFSDYKKEYEASHEDLMQYVKFVGHFDKTGQATALPSYVKDKHPVAGCATLFLPFGDKKCSISSPWSSLQKDKNVTEICSTRGCSVYLVSGKISDMIDDEVVCVYDGVYKKDDGNEQLQVVTETSGHEMGMCSKEMALSCFMSKEEAETMCMEFFGPDEDEEEDD